MLFVVVSRSIRNFLPIVIALISFIVTAQQFPPEEHKAEIAKWNGLQSQIEAELARQKLTCDPSEDWHPYVIDAIDLTGDGVPEAMVNSGNCGAYTSWLVLMRLEAGRPVVARTRGGHGKYVPLGFGSGTSAMHSLSYQLHPEIHAIYDINLDLEFSDLNASTPTTQTAKVNVYIWNPKTKSFDRDARLSREQTELQTTKRKPAR
jgi:hypothetical protein